MITYSPSANLIGLSTDTKPTNLPIGATFLETNTGIRFRWDGSTWTNETAPTQLGSGTADSTTYLRGDQTWATPPGGSNAFPIGAVFIAVVSTNPATLLGYGTWSAFGAGKMLIGLDSADVDFDTVEETGGAKTKTIAQANLPNISTGAGTAHNHTQDAHSHTQRYHATTTGGLSGPTTAPDTSSSSPTNYGIVTATTVATNQAEAAHTHSLGGSGTALNVVNPYIVVYMWKRTA